MVSLTGFGFFSDFAVLYRWSGEIWKGSYVGLYPYPLMVLIAPISLLPINLAAAIWFIAILSILVLALRRESLYWIFFIPFLQVLYLGQIDPIFWLIYRSKRPAVWALLSLKPQLLLLILPRIFAGKRNLLEFSASLALLQLPFFLLRPAWPMEWIKFLPTYQNRLTDTSSMTVSENILFSIWALPLITSLILLVWFRRKNLEATFFLINPLLLPYDYSILMGSLTKIIIPLSWLALWAAWRVNAGWPYAFMLLAVLLFETIRERRATIPTPARIPPPSSPG